MSKQTMIKLESSIVKINYDYSYGYMRSINYFDSYALWCRQTHNPTSINPSQIVAISSEQVPMGEVVSTKKTVKGGLFRSDKTIEEDVLNTNYKQWVTEYTIEMVGGAKHVTTMDIHAAIRAES